VALGLTSAACVAHGLTFAVCRVALGLTFAVCRVALGLTSIACKTDWISVPSPFAVQQANPGGNGAQV
jgi:hypothetical protein